jgi:hypothetical protein
MVVEAIPAIEVTALTGSRKLLAIGQFPQDADSVCIGCKMLTGPQIKVEALGAEQKVRGKLSLYLLKRKCYRDWLIQDDPFLPLHVLAQGR